MVLTVTITKIQQKKIKNHLKIVVSENLSKLQCVLECCCNLFKKFKKVSKKDKYPSNRSFLIDYNCVVVVV